MDLLQAQNYLPNERTVTAKSSAVIVLVVSGTGNRHHCLLLRRTNSIQFYPGDWCLPGGRKDYVDPDLLATAWRELVEETGITKQQCQLICQLDDFYTGHGELVRPFIVTLTQSAFDVAFKLQKSEVAEGYQLACEALESFSPDSPPRQSSTRSPTYHLRFETTSGTEYVWGLTASILAHAYNILNNCDMVIDYGIDYCVSNGH